ncbi:DUF2784 domain-containing protein [Phenylobacterium sp.]|jgi:hypothetical protein|uniref:DUF2784 domain-containing protein n=1 Tax=Phenylobacterium sp. TaxID=1871053 RepID=UPI002F3EE47B
MASTAAPLLGDAVLALHLAVIAFNVLGLIAILVGAARHWEWVHIRWWRLLHLASWGVVAAQALLGRACFLTLWQDQLSRTSGEAPLIMRWVNSLIYWPLPIWVFGVIYIALFALVVALWWRVPVRRTKAGAEGRVRKI